VDSIQALFSYESDSLISGMKKLLLILMGLWFCGAVMAQRTLIYCGKLIDPKAGQVLTEMTVIVTGGTVTAVQKGYVAAAADDKVIDLKNRTVMPGLIDSHVHWRSAKR
jgi:imidazolonepropionase-like amidohydrolase